jgi:uncharacterized membrane protein
VRLVGLVTRERFDDLPDGFEFDEDETIAVYCQMGYQVGGYTLFVPRSSVTPIDMSVEEGLRFSLMGAVPGYDAAGR